MKEDIFTQARRISRKIESHKAEGDLLVLQYAAIQKAIAAGKVDALDLDAIGPESTAEASKSTKPSGEAGKVGA